MSLENTMLTLGLLSEVFILGLLITFLWIIAYYLTFFSKFIIKTINKFIFQSGIQSMTSTPNNNSWETLKEKYMIKYIEYVYRSEDKLYQVLYDRKNRPEIYKLKKQQFDKNSITRYNELSMK